MVSRKPAASGRRTQGKILACYDRALGWIVSNTIPEMGIAVSDKRRLPYAEVTGYLIPTLFQSGEIHLAERYADYLALVQRPDGSFAGADGESYFFDTAQALRGLLKAALRWDKYVTAARRSADYLASRIGDDGRIPTAYGGTIPECVHVYALPPLLEAGEFFSVDDYGRKANLAADKYLDSPDTFNTRVLSHFLGYILEGFVEMGRSEPVEPVIREVLSSQRKDGGIPARPDVGWVCSVGAFQVAAVAYKMRMYDAADGIVDHACSMQRPSGGFYGSYGRGAGYFRNEEISWAAKFFLDAIHLKVASFFERHASIFPREILPEDGRLISILDYMGDMNDRKILDAGCGKGRIAMAVKEAYPRCEMHGLDISRSLLAQVPESIVKKEGSILDLPYGSETFDGVFCVEVLEHSLRTGKAISELCRVLKKDGRIIIIDKNLERLGALEITDFEQWFDMNEVADLLGRHCRNVQAEELIVGGEKKTGLFLAWKGIKGDMLLANERWHEVIVGDKEAGKLAEKIRSNAFPIWCRPLLESTRPGDSMLELGSGSGEISAVMTLYGRNPVLIDYCVENVEFARALFEELGVTGCFIHADIMEGIPLEDGSVDWVWSSGFLQHYEERQIKWILEESTRVCRQGVLSLVPNAASIFYRLGKYKMEKEGSWAYGKENPKYTMRNIYNEVGLREIEEYSVGLYHPLRFWGSDQEDIRELYDSLDPGEMRALNQGYLLFTKGRKR